MNTSFHQFDTNLLKYFYLNFPALKKTFVTFKKNLFSIYLYNVIILFSVWREKNLFCLVYGYTHVYLFGSLNL